MRSRHLYSVFVTCLVVQCVDGNFIEDAGDWSKDSLMNLGSFVHDLSTCGTGGCSGKNQSGKGLDCEWQGQYYPPGHQNTDGSIIESECEECPEGTFASEFSRKSKEDTCKLKIVQPVNIQSLNPLLTRALNVRLTHSIKTKGELPVSTVPKANGPTQKKVEKVATAAGLQETYPRNAGRGKNSKMAAAYLVKRDITKRV